MGQQDGQYFVALLLIIATSCQVKCLKSTFTEAEKREFVMIHNQLRETASPQASKMNFITWSYKLEALAVIGALRCENKHSEEAPYASLGENIFSSDVPDPVRAAVAWFTEKNSFINHQVGGACKSGFQCGHYDQIMGDTTREVGCGRNLREECKQVFCVYSPYSQHFTYGPPCSECPPDMPLCMNGLCVSSDIAKQYAGPTATVSASPTNCKIACNTTNCGKRNTASGNCKCDCETGTSGPFCGKKSNTAASTAACSPCTETPACLNEGVEDKTDSLKCKCTCKPGYVGERCEIVKDVFDSSVKLAIGAGQMYQVQNKYFAYPPISRSLLTEKIWTIVQEELAKLISSFCRKDATNFVKCCPGKTFPGDAGVASKSHVKAGDLKFTESSVGNTFDGSLNFLVHAVNTDSALCPGSTGNVTYVPQSVLLSAIDPNNNDVSAALLNKVRAANLCCYANITLKEVKAATLADLALGISDVSVTAVNYKNANVSITDLTQYDFRPPAKGTEPLRTMSAFIYVLSISLTMWLHLLVI